MIVTLPQGLLKLVLKMLIKTPTCYDPAFFTKLKKPLASFRSEAKVLNVHAFAFPKNPDLYKYNRITNAAKTNKVFLTLIFI